MRVQSGYMVRLLQWMFRLMFTVSLAMAMPVLFVLAMAFGDSDSKAFVTTFGSVLLPFGMALWSIAIFRRRARPWLTFGVTVVAVMLCIHFHVYEVGVR